MATSPRLLLLIPLTAVGCVTPVDFGPDSMIGFADPEDAVATVAETLTPFDADRQDQAGPRQTTYGKTPELVVSVQNHDLYVFAHDYGSTGGSGATAVGAKLLKLRRTEDDYIITRVIEPPGFLDRIVGMDHDPVDGTIYIASAVAEGGVVDAEYPENDQYREGVVHVSALTYDGEELFRTDLDVARAAAAESPEQVINPMVAATGRLAVGGGHVALVHGINTTPDPAIDNRRHQKALTTFLDADTGAVTRTSTIWVSHSFDQRLIWDGTGFVEHHLGDAYPRHIAFARTDPNASEAAKEFPLLFIKGESGANVTDTSIGSVVPLPETDSAAFLAVYSTERNAAASSREIGVVRVMANFDQVTTEGVEHLDTSLPDTMTTDLGEETPLRWLTDYQGESEGTLHADRPRMVDVGDGNYVVLWEKWSVSGDGGADFEGTWGMVIDANGETLVDAKLIVPTHLPRGDDPFALPDGRAAWLTGDNELKTLTIRSVDAELNYKAWTVE